MATAITLKLTTALRALRWVALCAATPALANMPSDGREYSQGNVTAQTLVDDIASGQEPRVLRAKNYMVGVIDLTEGRSWCSYMQVKPHIIAATVYEKLKKRPSAELQQRAARLIEEELKNHRPCKG